MKPTDINRNAMQGEESNSATSNLQKLYSERMERFMALVELSYALKKAPKIIQSK